MVDDCRQVFHLCRYCDHGQIYCSDPEHVAKRDAHRREIKQRHWLSHKGKLKTSARTSSWRAQHRKIETDWGRQEVGPAPMVSTAERSALSFRWPSPLLHKETYNEIDLDGHRPEFDDDAGGRDGGAEPTILKAHLSKRIRAIPSCTWDAVCSRHLRCGKDKPVRAAPMCRRPGRLVRLNLCRGSRFWTTAGRCTNLVWVPAGAHRQRRHRLHGLGNFHDLERLVLETVAR